jgi:hypothetical protein
MKRIITSMIALLSVGLPSTAMAGPWVKEAGDIYVKAAASTFSSDTAYDVNGDQVDPGFTYSNRSYTLYGEAGLGKRLALTFNLPLLFSVNELSERVRVRNNGLGDLDLGLQAAIWRRGACPVSGKLTGRVPLYSGVVSDGSTPGAQGLEPAEDDPQGLAVRFAPALGDGSIDITPTLQAGCSLYPIPAWVSVEAGPQFRLRGFGNGWIWATDAGIFVWPDRVALTARASGQHRFSSDNPRPTKSFVALGGGAIVRLPANLAFEANVSYVPGGAFVAPGWTFGAGVSFNGSILPSQYRD